MKASSKSSKEISTGFAEQFHGFISWRDLFGVVATVILAYQFTQLKSIQLQLLPQLAMQEARIIELEKSILNSLDSSSDPFIVKEIKNEAVSSVLEDDNAVEEHAPHSHYSIETIDGVPVNPGKKLRGFSNSI